MSSIGSPAPLRLVPFPSAQVGCKNPHLRPTCALCFLHWNHIHLCCRAFDCQLFLASDLPNFILPILWNRNHYPLPQPFAVAVAFAVTLATVVIANNCQPLTTIHRIACRCHPGMGVVRMIERQCTGRWDNNDI
jgi:hypothetical protein